MIDPLLFLTTLAQDTAAQAVSKTPLWIILGYLGLLMALGLTATRFFRGTSNDYFVASRSIGPFLLLMSVFGTTMTGFALVGSTAKSFESGIGVYGLMASWSGLIHSAVFFLVGIKLWAFGKRYGYVTQVQFFRDRFESNALGYVLFFVLVALVIPYLLVGIIAACKTVQPITAGMFPELFAMDPLPNGRPHPLNGGVPPWLTGLVICSVVMFYVFFGGVRSAVWANTFQTIVFMITGVVCFYMIANADKLGGLAEAGQVAVERVPEKVSRGKIGPWQFVSYMFIPLSVGMFPHLFQHWLTARSAKTFRLTVIAHPIFIAIVWVPRVLIGLWAAALYAGGEIRMPPSAGPGSPPNANAALSTMVKTLVESPALLGLLTAGILAAIMSSLDSQFVCLGTMFSNDIVAHSVGEDRFTDKQMVMLARGFVVAIVTVAYLLSMALLNVNVFDLGVWCFTGFGALFPLVFSAVYWKRVTRAGAWACVLSTAAVWFYFFYQDIIRGHEGEGEYLVIGLMPVAFIFLASLVSLVGVSLVTKPLSQGTIDKFFDPQG